MNEKEIKQRRINQDKKYFAFDVETKGRKRDKSGLSPKTRIMAISLYNDECEKIITSKDEKDLLLEFKQEIEKPGINIIGFNSTTFDVHRVKNRCSIHGIEIENLEQKNIDIRPLLPKSGGKKNKLYNYGKLIKYEFSTGCFCKSHIPLLWKYPDIEELNELVAEDSRITWELYKKLQAGTI